MNPIATNSQSRDRNTGNRCSTPSNTPVPKDSPTALTLGLYGIDIRTPESSSEPDILIFNESPLRRQPTQTRLRSPSTTALNATGASSCANHRRSTPLFSRESSASTVVRVSLRLSVTRTAPRKRASREVCLLYTRNPDPRCAGQAESSGRRTRQCTATRLDSAECRRSACRRRCHRQTEVINEMWSPNRCVRTGALRLGRFRSLAQGILPGRPSP